MYVITLLEICLYLLSLYIHLFVPGLKILHIALLFPHIQCIFPTSYYTRKTCYFMLYNYYEYFEITNQRTIFSSSCENHISLTSVKVSYKVALLVLIITFINILVKSFFRKFSIMKVVM